MLKVGLLSDTHNHLDKRVLDNFKDCDEIWHAGDIGSIRLANELAAYKTLRAVYGNIDGQDVLANYPEDLRFSAEGFDIWMTHIGGYPGHYAPRVKKLLDLKPPGIFICGHSHILRVMRDPGYKNMITLNPGAAGLEGFHKVKTLMRFTLNEGKMLDLQVIEIGKRGVI